MKFISPLRRFISCLLKDLIIEIEYERVFFLIFNLKLVKSFLSFSTRKTNNKIFS